MIKVFCDRCGKEVTQAYTIDIKNGTFVLHIFMD